MDALFLDVYEAITTVRICTLLGEKKKNNIVHTRKAGRKVERSLLKTRPTPCRRLRVAAIARSTVVFAPGRKHRRVRALLHVQQEVVLSRVRLPHEVGRVQHPGKRSGTRKTRG